MVVTRVYKVNQNIKAYDRALNELSELQTDCQQKTQTIQGKLNDSSKSIDLFKGMTDEEFDKTKYRKEEFHPI